MLNRSRCVILTLLVLLATVQMLPYVAEASSDADVQMSELDY